MNSRRGVVWTKEELEVVKNDTKSSILIYEILKI